MAGLSVTSAASYDLANNPTVHELTLTGTDFINGYGNGLDNTITGKMGRTCWMGGAGKIR